jgi:hypothetical protein
MKFVWALMVLALTAFARSGDANRLDYEDYLQALRTKKADRNSYIRFGKRAGVQLQHPHSTAKRQNNEDEEMLNSLNFLQAAANRNRRGAQESSYIRFGKRNTNVSNVKSYSCVLQQILKATSNTTIRFDI